MNEINSDVVVDGSGGRGGGRGGTICFKDGCSSVSRILLSSRRIEETVEERE